MVHMPTCNWSSPGSTTIMCCSLCMMIEDTVFSDKTADLVKTRVYWPCLAAKVEHNVKICGRYVQRKTLPKCWLPHQYHLWRTNRLETSCLWRQTIKKHREHPGHHRPLHKDGASLPHKGSTCIYSCERFVWEVICEWWFSCQNPHRAKMWLWK